MFTSSFLKNLRGKALRRKLWYKVLNRFDRSYYNLTCSVVARVESLDLGKEILSLVLQLKNALKDAQVSETTAGNLDEAVKLRARFDASRGCSPAKAANLISVSLEWRFHPTLTVFDM